MAGLRLNSPQKERQWRYRRGEFWQDYVRILRKRTPVALWERRILAGLRPDSPQKERQWRYRRGEFWQDYVRILRKRTPVALRQRRILAGLRPDSPQKNASGVTAEENPAWFGAADISRIGDRLPALLYSQNHSQILLIFVYDSVSATNREFVNGTSVDQVTQATTSKACSSLRADFRRCAQRRFRFALSKCARRGL